MGILQQIIDLFLPPRCINCGKILSKEEGLCKECADKIDFIKGQVCYKCGFPLYEEKDDNSHQKLCPSCIKKKRHPFRLMRSAFSYDDFSKKMILGLKFEDKTENAKIFASWLLYAGKDIFDLGADVLIPVPLHRLRLLQRKYNQSALIAKELSKLTGIKTDFISLIKSKHTKPQIKFNGRLRIKNIKDAFKVKFPENISGKRVVIIDDVITTGATVYECIKALKKAGAKSVDVLSVSRVL